MYNDGRGVDRQPDRALLWIELAANQGLLEAQYALGLLYYNGTGTERDDVIALKWFEVAAGYGHTSSAANIASLAQTMKKDDVVKARQLASIWKPSVRSIPVE
jgi:TPR repeat protein